MFAAQAPRKPPTFRTCQLRPSRLPRGRQAASLRGDDNLRLRRVVGPRTMVVAAANLGGPPPAAVVGAAREACRHAAATGDPPAGVTPLLAAITPRLGMGRERRKPPSLRPDAVEMAMNPSALSSSRGSGASPRARDQRTRERRRHCLAATPDRIEPAPTSGHTPPLGHFESPGRPHVRAPDTTPAPRAVPGLALVVARAVTSLAGSYPAGRTPHVPGSRPAMVSADDRPPFRGPEGRSGPLPLGADLRGPAPSPHALTGKPSRASRGYAPRGPRTSRRSPGQVTARSRRSPGRELPTPARVERAAWARTPRRGFAPLRPARPRTRMIERGVFPVARLRPHDSAIGSNTGIGSGTRAGRSPPSRPGITPMSLRRAGRARLRAPGSTGSAPRRMVNPAPFAGPGRARLTGWCRRSRQIVRNAFASMTTRPAGWPGRRSQGSYRTGLPAGKGFDGTPTSAGPRVDVWTGGPACRERRGPSKSRRSGSAVTARRTVGPGGRVDRTADRPQDDHHDWRPSTQKADRPPRNRPEGPQASSGTPSAVRPRARDPLPISRLPLHAFRAVEWSEGRNAGPPARGRDGRTASGPEQGRR